MDHFSEKLFPATETIGYANRTLLHPTGSYIGWEKATVFSLPLVYREDLDAAIAKYEENRVRLESTIQGLRDQLHAMGEVRKLRCNDTEAARKIPDGR